MSGQAATDIGSEDVNDFLQRIKELGDRRDQEDEERNKKLEEEILQGRKERQARRAGRSIPDSPLHWIPARQLSLLFCPLLTSTIQSVPDLFHQRSLLLRILPLHHEPRRRRPLASLSLCHPSSIPNLLLSLDATPQLTTRWSD